MKHGLTLFLKRLGMQKEKPHFAKNHEDGFAMQCGHETDKAMNEMRMALYERIRVRSLM